LAFRKSVAVVPRMALTAATKIWAGVALAKPLVPFRFAVIHCCAKVLLAELTSLPSRFAASLAANSSLVCRAGNELVYAGRVMM